MKYVLMIGVLVSVLGLVGVAHADCDEQACIKEYHDAKAKLNGIDNGDWNPATEEQYNDGKKALEVHDRCACAFQSPPIVKQNWDADKRYLNTGLHNYSHGTRKLNETPEVLGAFDVNYRWTYSPQDGGCAEIPLSKTHARPSWNFSKRKQATDGIFYSRVTENKSKGFLMLSGASGGGMTLTFFRDKKACNECKGILPCQKGAQVYSR